MKTAIQNLIEKNESLKSAYFWKGGDANRRAWTEKNYSVSKIEFDFDGVHYSAAISVHCSRNNVYVNRHFYRNGSKTTITVFKNLLSKIPA